MTTLQILSVLFATAALFGWISIRWLKLPITIGTMLLTVLISLALAGAGSLAPGMHAWAVDLAQQIDFGSIILHGMLPLLLFAGAFLLDLEELAREKLTVSLLSVVGTLLSMFLVAGLMFLLSGASIPWMQCLIFGALISPTDPIAVLEMLRRTGVPGPIQAQLAGESLFNDGIGAVLFLAMLDAAVGHAPTPWSIAGTLLLRAGGGIAIGILAAWVAGAQALGGYALADALSLSAPLEAVVAGIELRHFTQSQSPERIELDHLNRFWTVIDEIQNSVLFVLLGFETMAVTVSAPALLAGLAAIFSVNAVRLAAVALLLAVVHLVERQHQSSTFVMTWGGLRGGLSIALALSVPVALGGSWMLNATFLVVVFSIVVQGGSMDWLLRRSSRRLDV
jgi:CPA1 family monovalent cation:H+ antiporter